MSATELLAVLLSTVCICIPALLWVLREARADTASLIDDEEVLY